MGATLPHQKIRRPYGGVGATNYACADTRCLLTENADGLGTRARFALKLSAGGWAYLKQKENSLLVKQHNY